MSDTPLVTSICQPCIQSQCDITVLHKAQHLFITQKKNICSPHFHLLMKQTLPLLLHRASCRFTKYHTTNKCANCMSFILNHFFKTIFTAPTCFDSISLIIIREYI